MSAAWVPGGRLEDWPTADGATGMPLLYLPGSSGFSLDACFGADAGREHYPQ